MLINIEQSELEDRPSFFFFFFSQEEEEERRTIRGISVIFLRLRTDEIFDKQRLLKISLVEWITLSIGEKIFGELLQLCIGEILLSDLLFHSRFIRIKERGNLKVSQRHIYANFKFVREFTISSRVTKRTFFTEFNSGGSDQEVSRLLDKYW